MLLTSNSQKRTYQTFQEAQPGSSAVPGEQQSGSVFDASPGSSFGYVESASKRHRSDDFGQPTSYNTGERAVPAYEPRGPLASATTNVPNYSSQPLAPQQSPQTSYTFQSPSTDTGIPTFYPQGPPSASMRTMNTNSRQGQATTPGSAYSYPSGGMAAGWY